MTLHPDAGLAAAVLFLSTLVRATFGFGDALIAMPLLAVALGLRVATPLVALVASTLALAITLRSWRHIHLGSAWRLTLSSFAGIPVGMLLLKGDWEAELQLALGLLLIAFALFRLLPMRLPVLRGTGPTWGFGLVAGVLGGAYNTNGPPVVVYGAMRGWSPQTFRATLQGYFLVTGAGITVGHGLAGLWTPPVLGLYAAALPAVLVSLWIGGRLHGRLPEAGFQRGIHLLLLLMGALLVARTL